MSEAVAEITAIARKQRHLSLLRKVKEGQALSASELKELEQYEKSGPAKVVSEDVSVSKGRKASRRSLTEAECQRLGFSCRCIAEADKQVGGRSNLAKFFQRHRRLRAAFERGRLLRYIVELAPTALIYEAARKLKDMGFAHFETGQELRAFLDGDAEANELWESARVNAWIENRKKLREAAAAGNVKAIQLVDKWSIDRQREQGEAAINFARVPVGQMTELFGVTRQCLHEWSAGKGLPRNIDGSFDLIVAIKWFEDFTTKKATRGKDAVSPDKLRDLKAEQMALDLAKRRGELLDRQSVVAGLAARWQKLVASFSAKHRELARMLHGQTIERIADILERFFEDLLRSQLEIPEFLELPEAAAAKLTEALELCKILKDSDRPDESDRSDR